MKKIRFLASAFVISLLAGCDSVDQNSLVKSIEITKDSITIEELEVVQKLHSIQPNVVTDIFKVRSGEWNQVRIWSYIDLGTMRKQDLFITDSRLEPIKEFFDGYDIEAITFDWEDDFVAEINNVIFNLNEKLKEV